MFFGHMCYDNWQDLRWKKGLKIMTGFVMILGLYFYQMTENEFLIVFPVLYFFSVPFMLKNLTSIDLRTNFGNSFKVWDMKRKIDHNKILKRNQVLRLVAIGDTRVIKKIDYQTNKTQLIISETNFDNDRDLNWVYKDLEYFVKGVPYLINPKMKKIFGYNYNPGTSKNSKITFMHNIVIKRHINFGYNDPMHFTFETYTNKNQFLV